MGLCVVVKLFTSPDPTFFKLVEMTVWLIQTVETVLQRDETFSRKKSNLIWHLVSSREMIALTQQVTMAYHLF